VKPLLLAACLALPLAAQPFQFDLRHLESKATEPLDLSLTHSTLRLAARFMDDKDPEDAEVKKLIEGIEGIYIKSFDFKDGELSKADLDRVREQLRAPEWLRTVGFKNREERDTAEVYVREVNKKVAGVAMICAGPKALTVVNIAGPVDLDSLADLSGHFGVPKLDGKRK